jgi:mRNA interferase RelE/StbE
MVYEIKLKKSAQKDLDALDNIIYIRIDNAIQGLKNDPFPRGVKKLRGGESRYRVRIGKYRMLYEVDHKHNLVIIYRIKLRSVAYD